MVEPQAIATRTAIDHHRFPRPDLNSSQTPLAARAFPLAVLLPLSGLQSGAQPTRFSAGRLGNCFELTGIEPDTATVDAAVQLNTFKLKANEGYAANRTH